MSNGKISIVSIITAFVLIASFAAAFLPQAMSPQPAQAEEAADWGLSDFSYRQSMNISSPAGTYANTGGTITTDGDYTVHTFTGGGTFTAGKSGTVEVLVVGGGGGAGGLIYISDYAISAGDYTVVVGTGGSGSSSWSSRGQNGNPSAFGTLTALGGGGGGSRDQRAGGNGGSGGGAAVYQDGFFFCSGAWNYAAGGSSTQPTTNDGYPGTGFGNAGGTSSAGSQTGQGGGGAGGAGLGTTGGPGLTFWGVTYAKGGDAHSDGSNGTPNTGNGGNARPTDSGGDTGGSGGSGIVIVRCLTTDFMSDNSQTDYQMRLTVRNENGDSAGSTAYLNGNSLNWPYDIRFTKSDGTTLLDYWIEENNPPVATVWVKFDAIPALPDEGLFYIYYGNADAADASNGENTFIFFDDFSGDLSKWTKHKNGDNINIANGYLEMSGGDTLAPYGHTVLGSGASYDGFTDGIIEGKVYLDSNAIAEVGYRGDYAANTGYKSRMDNRVSQGLGHLMPPYADGSWGFIPSGGGPSGAAVDGGTWHDFSITVSGPSLSISCGGQTLNGTDATYTGPGEISLQNHYGAYARFDDIRVRKYADPEPIWGAWGPEETRPVTTSIEITAPGEISDWILSPAGGGENTRTGDLIINVTPDDASWTVTAQDLDGATGGYMTQWDGSTYGTSKLTNPLRVQGHSEISLPGGGVIASGTGTATVTVTFKQTVEWTDAPDDYRIMVTFIGAID